MFKLIAFNLVLVSVTGILLLSEAHDYRNDENSDSSDANFESTSVKHDFSAENQKNFPKKYHKEGEKKNSYPEKEPYHKEKHWKQRNESDQLPRNKKFSKYDKRENYNEDPSKNKNVNYHDKTGYNEKVFRQVRKVQEIVEHATPISLHHDIDVNYLVHHNTVPSDVEVIDVGGTEHTTPISLHHDIDVNYLVHHNTVPSDAKVTEFAEIGNQIKKSIVNQKKKDYIKNFNDDKKIGKETFYRDLKTIDLNTIPPSNNSALVARYIIHNVDWTALGTLSTNRKLKGSPFVNVISTSDGPLNKGSGVPFFYMTPKDFSSMDLEKDNRCSIAVTLAQTNFCKTKNFDPESPLCARLILSGKMKKIKPGSKEEDFAKIALFSRHPEMKNWPADHDWFFSKLKIKQIILINHFGGASYINRDDYFNVNSA